MEDNDTEEKQVYSNPTSSRMITVLTLKLLFSTYSLLVDSEWHHYKIWLGNITCFDYEWVKGKTKKAKRDLA